MVSKGYSGGETPWVDSGLDQVQLGLVSIISTSTAEIAGNYAIVCDGAANEVWILVNTSSNYAQQQLLTADPYFDTSIHLIGSIISAISSFNGDSGSLACYVQQNPHALSVWTRSGINWTEQVKLFALANNTLNPF
jgi:hypothetical protein